jgi:hypothetical protein
MRKLTKPEKVGYINMLVYGDPGSGKTVFAGSADANEETGRTLFLDAESGKTSLYEFYPDIDVVPIHSIKDFQEVYDFLHTHLRLKAIFDGTKSHKKVSPEQAKEKMAELEAKVFGSNRAEARIYNSVAMDTFTEMQKYVMADIQGLDTEKLDLISKEIDMPKLQDWGKNSEACRSIARAFRNLEMHTILTTHAQDSKDDKTGANHTLPDLPGKLARQIMGFVDIVGYLYTAENEEEENDDFRNILLTRPKGRYSAKDRFDKLGDHIELPTIEKIFNLINA